MNVEKNKKGFTLMEMLIVVAIIAVLVAIAIPVLSNNLHKAKVATDWANLRAMYASLQADYLATGEYIPEYPEAFEENIYNEARFYSDGQVTQTVPLKAGICSVIRTETGYQIIYYCNDAHPTANCCLAREIKRNRERI